MAIIASDAATGPNEAKPKKPIAFFGARGPARNRYKENAAKKMNAPTAKSEIGIPPQYFSLKSAEYGLYIAARQASAASVGGAPGMMLQWMSCSLRSRCFA